MDNFALNLLFFPQDPQWMANFTLLSLCGWFCPFECAYRLFSIQWVNFFALQTLPFDSFCYLRRFSLIFHSLSLLFTLLSFSLFFFIFWIFALQTLDFGLLCYLHWSSLIFHSLSLLFTIFSSSLFLSFSLSSHFLDLCSPNLSFWSSLLSSLLILFFHCLPILFMLSPYLFSMYLFSPNPKF